MAKLIDMLRAGTRFRVLEKPSPDSGIEPGSEGVVTSFFMGVIRGKVENTDSRGTTIRFISMNLQEFGQKCEILEEGPVLDRPERSSAIVRLADVAGDEEFVPVETRWAESASAASSTPVTAPLLEPKKERTWEELTQSEQQAALVKLDFWFVVGNEDTYYSADNLWESGKRAALEHMEYEIRKNADGKPCVLVHIPPEHAAWRKTSKHVATCAFAGTDEYLKHVLGMSLHGSDREWYVDHPLTETGGLPAQHTITLLNDLVRPWGLGVSRVWMRKGHIDWPEHGAWKDVLGCNDMAYADNETSDEEFVREMLSSIQEDTPEEQREALRQWAADQVQNVRFSYVKDLPSAPMVIFEGGYTSKYASGGGHASFRAPRSGKGDNWGLAVQFDRLENCRRLVEPPSLDVLDGERAEHLTLDVRQCKIRDGSAKLESKITYQSGFRGTWSGDFPGGGTKNGTNTNGKSSQGFRPSQKPGKSSGKKGKKGKQQSTRLAVHHPALNTPQGLRQFGRWVEVNTSLGLKQLESWELVFDPIEERKLIKELQELIAFSEVLTLLDLFRGEKGQFLSWRHVLTNPESQDFLQPVKEQFSAWAEPYVGLHSLVTVYSVTLALAELYNDWDLAEWATEFLLGDVEIED